MQRAGKAVKNGASAGFCAVANPDAMGKNGESACRNFSTAPDSHIKILFVSGKFRGDELANIAIARDAASEIAEMGWGVFCPHTHSQSIVRRNKLSDADVRYWLELDKRFLEICYGIVMLPDWEISEGAKEEYEKAKELGLCIYLWPDDKEILKNRW